MRSRDTRRTEDAPGREGKRRGGRNEWGKLSAKQQPGFDLLILTDKRRRSTKRF